jgi:hypothetical protein
MVKHKSIWQSERMIAHWTNSLAVGLLVLQGSLATGIDAGFNAPPLQPVVVVNSATTDAGVGLVADAGSGIAGDGNEDQRNQKPLEYGNLAQWAALVVALTAVLLALRAQAISAVTAFASIHEKFWNDAAVAEIRSDLTLEGEQKKLMMLLSARSYEIREKKHPFYSSVLCKHSFKKLDRVDQFLAVLHRVVSLRNRLAWPFEPEPITPRPLAWQPIESLDFKPRPSKTLFDYWSNLIANDEYGALRSYAELCFPVTFKAFGWPPGSHVAVPPALVCEECVELRNAKTRG